MTPRIAPARSHPSPLTLNHIVAVIAALSLGFPFLPFPLSATLTITLVGGLVLRGKLRPPIAERGGVWRWLPWVLWWMALAACPIAIEIVGEKYEHTGYPAFDGPLPWAARLVDNLGLAHLVVSIVAAGTVVVLTRGGFLWLAWAAILAVGAFTALLYLGAKMSTTGVYL